MQHRSVCLRFVAMFALLFACGTAHGAATADALGELRLCPLFGDHMVLQRECDASIWGRAGAGESVRIRAGWQSEDIVAKADADGRWRTHLHTPKAGGPYSITFKAGRNVKLEDVWIGEVWLASGQSNMEMPIANAGAPYTGIQDADKEVAAANWPHIRMFDVDNRAAAQPTEEITGKWSVCSSNTAGGFSATAYFFARELYKNLDMSIGIVNSSWGGTAIDTWMSASSLAAFPQFAERLKQLGLPAPTDTKPAALANQETPSALYNGMIAPLVPFALRGVIWYQGEANRGDGDLYRQEMAALIGDWRARWQSGDFPFGFVQIASHRYRGDTGFTALLREAQLRTLEVPNTGMAVTMDIGDKADIHPKNKQEVGRRLALWALAKTYGKETLEYSGPLYRELKIEADVIRVSFDHAKGLVARGGEPGPFLVAGADHQFVPAHAHIEHDTVVVSSPDVKEPLAVRYAWVDWCEPTLFNAAGLPASPFRTDTW